MQPMWITKTDPEHHPARYMAKVWQSKMKDRFGVVHPEFTPQEYGQLKTLMKHLGKRTPDVIDWSLDDTNWWHFCQRAKASHKLWFVPNHPEIGFLLQFRGHAVKMMNASR